MTLVVIQVVHRLVSTCGNRSQAQEPLLLFVSNFCQTSPSLIAHPVPRITMIVIRTCYDQVNNKDNNDYVKDNLFTKCVQQQMCVAFHVCIL